MNDNSSERALLAILTLEPEVGSPLDKEAQAFAEAPMPALDARVEKYLRAMREGDSDAGDPAKARELILAAMANDLATRGERNGEDRGFLLFRPIARRFSQARKPTSLGIRQATSARPNRVFQRIGAFAASAAALLIVGWTGAWFYALHSFNTTIAEWRAWEDKSGRQYVCATEGFGGTPFRVEMLCDSPKATIITENGKFTAEAKQLRVAVDLLHPGVIVSKLEGPVSFAELGKPDSFAGRWSHAEATVAGPRPMPDGLTVELTDFKVDRVANGGTEPLAAAEKVAFRARLDPIATAATQRAAYNLTSDITAGSLPFGPPIAARPFEARVRAVLHGVGDMTPKPLPARIKGWQRNGGLVELTGVEIRGTAADTNAQGTLALSDHGGVEGLLELSGEHYDRLLEALAGKNPEFATRRLPESGTKSQPSQTESRKLPALRFEDGAVYFGSTPLGRLPPLF
ncbi:MAG: DUF2125 domain-containing protein [Methylocella sp.]